MKPDRVVKLLLGTIAILLAALALQGAGRSSAQAQPNAESPLPRRIVYEARKISEISIDNVQEVVPLTSDPVNRTATFAVSTPGRIHIYRLDNFREAAAR